MSTISNVSFHRENSHQPLYPISYENRRTVFDQYRYQQNAITLGIANRTKMPPYLCYKYIPALDGPPDASYPTLWKMDTHLNQLWMGKTGEVYIGNPSEEDVSYYAQITTVLAALPVRKVIQAIRARGSGVLRYDLYRRLK